VNANEKSQGPNDTLRLLRIATVVHDGLLGYHQRRKTEAMMSLSRLNESLDELRQLLRRFQWAQQRSMQAAMTSQIDQAGRQMRILSCQFGEIQHQLDDCQQAPPKLADVLAELTQAEDEFDQAVKFERAAKTLSLTTDRIVLEDLDLGRFEIQMRLDELGRASQGRAYQVIAKEPNPASGNDHVPHPHVSHDTLCEGDAMAAIRSSLVAGRLCDFFTLVRSVLTTYNPDSPYVRLDEWDGTPCYDCGASIGSDDLFFCERCEHDYCESCIGSCRVCGTTSCYECMTRCESCDRMYCEACGGSCDECGESVCKSCLIECSACGSKVCDACLKACKGCNRRLCQSCVTDELCKECAEKQQPTKPEEPVPHEQQEQTQAAPSQRRGSTTGRRRLASRTAATAGTRRAGRPRRRPAA
jgi:hypothetical protein